MTSKEKISRKEDEKFLGKNSVKLSIIIIIALIVGIGIGYTIKYPERVFKQDLTRRIANRNYNEEDWLPRNETWFYNTKCEYLLVCDYYYSYCDLDYCYERYDCKHQMRCDNGWQGLV